MNKIRHTRKGHKPCYIFMYQMVPGVHSPTKVPLAHQIPLFTELLVLLTWIILQHNTEKFFLVIPHKVLPPDHHKFGLKAL